MKLKHYSFFVFSAFTLFTSALVAMQGKTLRTICCHTIIHSDIQPAAPIPKECEEHINASQLVERHGSPEAVLLEAAQHGIPTLVSIIINDYTTNLETQTEGGATALSLAAANGDLQTLKNLLRAGANPERCDNYQRSPLMWAAMNGKLDIVSALLAYDANPHAQTTTGETALSYAKKNRHENTMVLLQSYIASSHFD